MTVSIAKVRQYTATVEVDFYGETVQVEYRPATFTSEWMAGYLNRAVELDQESRESTDDDLLLSDSVSRGKAELMLMLLSGWNIVIDADNTLPLDVDAVVANLPEQLTTAILGSVWAHYHAHKPQVIEREGQDG